MEERFAVTVWSDFVPVSIKMAKEQSLSLNPAKISGMRKIDVLFENESDTYEYLNKRCQEKVLRVNTWWRDRVIVYQCTQTNCKGTCYKIRG